MVRRVVALVALLSMAMGAGAETADEKVCKEVFDRLLPYVEAPPGVGWPPDLVISPNKEVNAFATIDMLDNQAKVVVQAGFVDAYRNDLETALAFVLGHEFSHLQLGHCQPQPSQAPGMMDRAYTRRQELDADFNGMRTAMKAGYRYRDLCGYLKREALDPHSSYSSYEGAGLDHPSWTDRVAALDKGQSRLWRSKSAFDAGVTLLATMQCRRAAESFQEVVEDFPDCYEAWANLAHCYLMAYVDTLNVDYLKQHNLGMLMYTDFYTKPNSLPIRVRGGSDDLHQLAVEAAQRSLQVEPKQVLGWTNLGVACLVAPGGPRLEEAEKCFVAALQRAEDDSQLTPIHAVGILNNLACVYLARGKEAESRKALAKARELNTRFKRPSTGIIEYNVSLLDLKSQDPATRRKALEGMRSFLKTPSGETLWAQRARELLKQNHEKVAETVSTTAHFRPISQAGPVSLLLTEEEVQKRLGPGQETPCGPGVVRLCYPSRGLEIYLQDAVYAISLLSPRAPAVEVRPSGIGSQPWQIRVGDEIAPIYRKLAKQRSRRQTMLRPDQYFTSYRDIGLSLREEQGKVAEILIAAPTN